MKQFRISTIALVILSLFTFSKVLFAAEIERVEPPCWWIGMKSKNLQLLVYGKDIATTTPTITYDGVTLQSVEKVKNPNYLFLNLVIAETTKAGKVTLVFTDESKKVIKYEYELKQRKSGSSERVGFNSSDVIYLITPDRFANGAPANDNAAGMLEKADRNNSKGRHGGDIKGILNNLDHIANLGMTAIWVNPFLENNMPRESYHGYAITDFYKSDARFGSNDEFLKLVDECHKRGMKVIMDMINNHCGKENWFIKDLPCDDWIHMFPEFTRSNFRAATISDPYGAEVDRKRMTDGWFDTTMPDLNQKNPFVAKYLTQNAIWWVEYSGLDGIRMDTQPYPDKNMMTDWATSVFNEYPNFNVVGEAWIDNSAAITAYWQKGNRNADGFNSGFPSVTDFPLCMAMGKSFNETDGWESGNLRLYYTLAQDFVYPNAFNNVIFLDNHDLDRYFGIVGRDSDKMKMALSFLLTTRGIPMIYYGTEILMSENKSKNDGYVRQDFPGGWVGDKTNCFTKEGRNAAQNDVYNYIQSLCSWRKTNKTVQTGKLKQFLPENDVYVYFRYEEKNAVMILLNNSKESREVVTDRFGECIKGFTSGENVITKEKISDLKTLKLKPKSATIIELKKE